MSRGGSYGCNLMGLTRYILTFLAARISELAGNLSRQYKQHHQAHITNSETNQLGDHFHLCR